MSPRGRNRFLRIFLLKFLIQIFNSFIKDPPSSEAIYSIKNYQKTIWILWLPKKFWFLSFSEKFRFLNFSEKKLIFLLKNWFYIRRGASGAIFFNPTSPSRGNNFRGAMREGKLFFQPNLLWGDGDNYRVGEGCWCIFFQPSPLRGFYCLF